jgi:sulfotransferase 6B1
MRSTWFAGKHALKQVRWQVRRLRAGMQYGPGALAHLPVVFGNAMPKSGSHLLTQILSGLTLIGPFVDPGFPPVNRSEDNRPLPSEKVIRNLEGMRPGDIRYGYIHATEPYLSILTGPQRATIFLYRDPRDMIISHVFYATDLNADHGMHRYYNQKLDSMEARIDAAIRGVTEPGFELASVRQRYDSYRGWLDQPGVLCLKFEDLILAREAALNRLLDYLAEKGFQTHLSRQAAVDSLAAAIAPRKSGTFRKGIPGNWQEHFTPANLETFRQMAGNLLDEWGYGEDLHG